MGMISHDMHKKVMRDCAENSRSTKLATEEISEPPKSRYRSTSISPLVAGAVGYFVASAALSGSESCDSGE